MNTLLLGNNKEDIKAAAAFIKKGGVVAMPTETVYGLAADALSGDAVAKIFKAKGRPMDNPLIVHIADIGDIERFGLVSEFDERAKLLAKHFWPGPLTIIMKKSDVIPDEVSAGLDTVAIRLPNHKVAQQLIKESNTVLAAPSANKSGSPSPTTANHVMNDLDGVIDAIVDGGMCDVGVESTVITLAEETPRLLRPGLVTVEDIEAVIGHIEVDNAVLYKLESNEKASSPGMKYKHYAPKAKVVLINGDNKSFVEFVNNQFDGDNSVGAICYDEDEKMLRAKTICIGKSDDLETQARLLFDALRQVDELENVTTVYAHCPKKDGVGMALYNRLIRAASFEVIDINPTCVVGLTGPIGSGKTMVASLFESKGYKVVDADAIARRVVEKGSQTLKKLVDEFTEEILNSDGTLNRRCLAKKAFATKEGTSALNSITHPAIVDMVKSEIDRYKNNGCTKILYDAPLLFESKTDALCSKIVAVVADAKIRLDRVKQRDGLDADEIRKRIDAQQTDRFYIEKSDYVIYNNSSVEELTENTLSVISAIDEVCNGTF